MDTLENLRRKSEGAVDLKSVVRTMKALAASNIVQYETAVTSLADYYRTIMLGFVAYFRQEKTSPLVTIETPKIYSEKIIRAIVFGSDQGLVGQYNDILSGFVVQSLKTLPGKKEIWAVGERVQLLLADAGFTTTKLFAVPNSVSAITPLVGEILAKSEKSHQKAHIHEVYIFHNRPLQEAYYTPVLQRLLPLDVKWKHIIEKMQWPTKQIPQVAGGTKATLLALVHEYLFASLFKACAESLASENASRLDAMQRAEKNIEELLDDLNRKFHRLRQSTIDEELFEVVSGFEAISN